MIQIIINEVISYSHSLYDYTIKSDGEFVGTGSCSGVQIRKSAHGHTAYTLYRLDAMGIQQHIITFLDAVVTLGKDVPETVVEDFTVPDGKKKMRMNACHGKAIP